MNDKEYLMHYGVKGMKWGVRKDRYESRRTRKLRTGIESYDADIRDKSFSPRAHRMLVRDREKLYSKYNKQKERDYVRKQYANRHPSHLRNVGSFIVKDMGIGLAVGAAGGLAIAALGSKPEHARYIRAGARVAALSLGAQNIYEHVERARAIEGVQTGGRYDLKRR